MNKFIACNFFRLPHYTLGILFSTFNIFLFFSFSFFIALYFNSIGMNGKEIGILVGSFLGAGLISPLLGFLNDRLQVKTLLGFGFILLALCFFLLPNMTHFFSILPVYLIGGCGFYIIDISSNTLILKYLEDANSGKSLGKFQLIRNIAIVIGIFLGGLTINTFGFPVFFKILAFCYTLIILAIFLVPKQSQINSKISEYASDIKDEKVLFFCFIIFLFGLHWGTEHTCYSLFLKEKFSLNSFDSAIFMAIPIFILAITSYFAGLLYQRGANIYAIMLGGMCISSLGLFFFVQTNNITLSLVFRIIHEIGDAFFYLSIFFGASKFFPKHRQGGNFGFINLVMIFATVVGSLIFGPLGQHISLSSAHIIAGIMGIISCILLFFALSRRHISLSKEKLEPPL